MKFTANREALIAELRYVLSAYRPIVTQAKEKGGVPTRTRLPVSCQIAAGLLTLQTYDQRTALTASVPVVCDEEEPTRFATYVDVFVDYLDLIAGDQVEIDVTSHRTRVTHPDGHLSLPNLLEQPTMPSADDGAVVSGFSLTAADIEAMFKATAFATIKASNNEVSGTLFAAGTGFTRMVATNGNVIAVAEILEETPIAAPFDFVLTPDALARLRAVIRDADDLTPVYVEHRTRIVVGRCGSRSFISSHATGLFPRQYDKLLSQPLTHRLDAVCDDVRAAVRLAMLADSEEATVTLTLSKDGLGIASAAATCDILPAFCNNDEPLEIAVNGRYFTNALAACPTTRVELRSSVLSKRVVLEPVGGALAWKTAISSITPKTS